MEHLLIALYTAVLVAGALSALAVYQMKGICKDAFLSSYFRFILFFCFLTLLYQFAIYFHVNLFRAFPDSSALPNDFSLVRYLLTYGVVSGWGTFFIQSALRLSGRSTPTRLMSLYRRTVILFVFFYGVGTALYFREHNLSWISGIQDCLLTGVIIFVLSALILLHTGTIPSAAQEKKTLLDSFVYFYAGAFVLFFLTIKPPFFLPFRLPLSKELLTFANILVLFSMGSFPLVWAKTYFNNECKNLKRSFSDPVDLDELSDRYQLSDREGEILNLIIQGMSNKEIMNTLYLSHGTVRNHTYHLYRKLGVKSRMKLMTFILEYPKKP